MDFTESEMMGWQWHQLDHMQVICTSLSSFTGQMLILLPIQQHQSAEVSW